MIGVVAVTAAVAVVQAAFRAIPGYDALPLSLVGPVVLAATALLAYLGFVRWIERRDPTELSLSGASLELAAGTAAGALLYSATIGVLAAAGCYSITGTNAWTAALPTLGLSLVAGVAEEIVFRGIVFRIVEERLGTIGALAISASIFGAIHLANPNSSLTAAAAIVLEAGILLGAAYVLTRRLWLPIAIHFAWNFTQGGIFGGAVSGTEIGGILRSELHGPELLTGGSFGAEASVVAVVVCGAAGATMLGVAHRKGRFVPPFWRRNPPPGDGSDRPEGTSAPTTPTP